MSVGGGADSGQAANGGLWGAMSSWGNSFWGSADPGALAGGGVIAPETQAWTDKLKTGLAIRASEGLPGYGNLWEIGADGVQVTQAGKLVAVAVAVGLGLLIFGGKKGRW